MELLAETPIAPHSLALIRRLAAADKGLAVISTLRRNGTIQSSLVNAGVLDHPVTGRPTIALVARGDSAKLRILRHTPRATVVFRSGWEWVAAEGPVDLAGPNDPLDGFPPAEIPRLLRDVFVAAGGTHDNWAEYDRVMAEEGRTAVLIRPERVYSNPRQSG